MPRRVLMLVVMAVYTLVSAAGFAGPALAQENKPVGKVTLYWTMTVQGSDTFSAGAPSSKMTEKGTDQIALTYEGRWTWQVTRDDASVGRLEMDRGQGEYNVSGSGGGGYQEDSSGAKLSSNWTYQAQKGDDGHAYAMLARQGDEMYYGVDWDWDQEITLEGEMTSSSLSDKCGTSTFYGSCPGADGARAEAILVLGQAMPGWQEDKSLEGKVRPKDWGFSVSGTASYSPEPFVENKASEDYHSEHTMRGSAVLEYTLSYEREPSNLEAVITFSGGEGEYKQWRPEAGDDEDTVGSQLPVEVELRYKDRPGEVPLEKAAFRFVLVGASREPGVCLNAPAKGKARNTPDLKIDQDSNPDLDVRNEGQSAATKEPARGAGANISAFDWGAYGRLKVTATTEDGRTLTAHLDGQPAKEILVIPCDDNDNHIADAWEKQQGVYAEPSLSVKWDGAWDPADQKSDGDGISFYERYRGFELGTGNQVHHERLDVANKYIFIYDPTGVVLMSMVDPRGVDSSVPKVSKCRVALVDDEHWSGAGEAGSRKRIVNFNTSGYGHAVDQHALDVRLDASDAPVPPPEWEERYEERTGHPYEIGTQPTGIAFADKTFARPFASPGGTLRISVLLGNIERQIVESVRRHTAAVPAWSQVEAQWDDLTAAQQAQARAGFEADVQEYIRTHVAQWQERWLKKMASVISHEVGHGVGVDDHKPDTSGSKSCVMRYFSDDDCPPNENDRFELACRSPWPNQLCKGGADCWGQVQVSDK